MTASVTVIRYAPDGRQSTLVDTVQIELIPCTDGLNVVCFEEHRFVYVVVLSQEVLDEIAEKRSAPKDKLYRRLPPK
jgi:hypothetical protein